jgi:HEAT repeat protein
MFNQLILEVVMKKSIVLIVVFMLVTLLIPMMAEESALLPSAHKALMEDNLLFGLSTNNIGLQRSCALLLGKVQSDKAVIPLMAVLSHNPSENVRIAAAWALCKIGDTHGVDAVKIAVKYDESLRVQAICEMYYENIVRQGKFSLPQPGETMIANAK